MQSAFTQHAQDARDRYVAFYRSVLKQYASGPEFAAEILIKPNGRNTPEPFCLMRADVILGSAPDFRIKRCRDALQHTEPIAFVGPHGLHIEQRSFSWEALRLRFTSERFHVELLEHWLVRWLDPSKGRPPDSDGLAGVVHDLSWAQSDSREWELNIDFGSAPVAALEELLGCLSKCGVRDVTVSRHDIGV
jgi:hypothetical protein